MNIQKVKRGLFILKSLYIDCIVYHGIGKPLYLKLPKLHHEYYLLDLCNLCHLVINNHNNFRRGRKNMDWPKWNELHASAWEATICILRKQDRLDRLQHCKWDRISWRKKNTFGIQNDKQSTKVSLDHAQTGQIIWGNNILAAFKHAIFWKR